MTNECPRFSRVSTSVVPTVPLAPNTRIFLLLSILLQNLLQECVGLRISRRNAENNIQMSARRGHLACANINARELQMDERVVRVKSKDLTEVFDCGLVQTFLQVELTQ